MISLSGKIAVVAGASSGIGRAVALELAAHGAVLALIGRDQDRLDEAARAARVTAGSVHAFCADLSSDHEVGRLVIAIETQLGQVDILVHSAGVMSQGRIQDAPSDALDEQYRTNVRGPYMLTQALLPGLRARHGQVVFVNSTVSLAARADVGQYAATQHARKALADSLREEVNPDGVRVLSVYPGRTATPLQERIFAAEGREYRPELLLQPEDVASVIVHCLGLPPTAEVTNLTIRPLIKSY
jgi:NADP-dependent 3-hydroxy acid dehydrogenase YdfG